MKMMTWNCQGLGRPLTIHNMRGIYRSHSPKVVFLCETKNQTLFVTNVMRKCGYLNVHCVTPRGLFGGLVVGWKEEAQVSIVEHDDFVIHLKLERSTKNAGL